MRTARIFLSIGFLLLFPFISKAQHKYEREYRIMAETIPQSAKEFVDSIGSDSKIKWYKEISLKDITLEAKFKFNKKKFSVEFDTLGKLQDVELVIRKIDISSEIYTKIENQLDSIYQKWKIQKIQLNYSGKSSHIVAALRTNETSNSIKIAYEIVLKGKNVEETNLYEITFNEQGELKNILQFIQEKADHLEY